MEIVDRVTGHISPYPAHSDEFHSMKMQIDWQQRFRNFRYYYRLRYFVNPDSATAAENAAYLLVDTKQVAHSVAPK